MKMLTVRNKGMRDRLNQLSFFAIQTWRACPPTPDDGRILFRNRDRADYYFLSDFFPAPFVLDGEK